MYVSVITVGVDATSDKVAVKVANPAAFSAIDVVPVKVTVNGGQSSVSKLIAVVFAIGQPGIVTAY